MQFEYETKKRYRVGKKTFLSPEAQEFGTVAWDFSVPQQKDRAPYYIFEGSVRISDCSEHITLSFDAHKRDMMERRLQKLDTLIGAITEFRDKIYENMEQININAAMKDAEQAEREARERDEDD